MLAYADVCFRMLTYAGLIVATGWFPLLASCCSVCRACFAAHAGLVVAAYAGLVVAAYARLVVAAYAGLVVAAYARLVVAAFAGLVVAAYAGLVVAAYAGPHVAAATISGNNKPTQDTSLGLSSTKFC